MHVDPFSGLPFVLLHIHGPRAGAAAAVNMCTAILHRHMENMKAGKSYASAQSGVGVNAVQMTEQRAVADAVAQPQPQHPMPVPLPLCAAEKKPERRGSPETPEKAPLPSPTRRRWLRAQAQDGSSEEADESASD